MKSYDELKAKMETIQQEMAEAKKNERANALKEVNAPLYFASLAMIVLNPFMEPWLCVA
jgi:hypothetical protein